MGSQRLKGEQSNTSFLYGDTFYFKLLRMVKEGINPDQEIVSFLTERKGFRSTPPFAGSIEYRSAGSEPAAIGLLLGFVRNESDGWTYTRDAIGRYFERVLSKLQDMDKLPKAPASLYDVDPVHIPPLLEDLIEGHYLEMTALLGRRTGRDASCPFLAGRGGLFP